MSPLSWPVVIGTLVVGSPALYAAQVSGTLSPDVALVRLLICMAGVWLACSVVASLVEGTVAANKLAAVADADGRRAETAEFRRRTATDSRRPARPTPPEPRAYLGNAATRRRRAQVGPAPVDVMTGSPAGRVTAMDSPAAVPGRLRPGSC